MNESKLSDQIIASINFNLFLARDPVPPPKPVSLALNAQPDVPPFRQASRLPQGREHSGQGEETPQRGGNAGHHPGTKLRITTNGEGSLLFVAVRRDDDE